jgi:hypothetical protein
MRRIGRQGIPVVGEFQSGRPVTEPLRTPESRDTGEDDTLLVVRRIFPIVAAFAALVAPAVASAVQSGTDGSLVVRNGAAPSDTAVVALRITGSVIGRVSDSPTSGMIIIDSGADPNAPQGTVSGAGKPLDVAKFPTAQKWVGSDFTFRAVGGTFTILVYGAHVNLVAAGHGTVRLAGMPDTPHGDGTYSLNDKDFVSLPGVQTAKLTIGTTTAG